MIFIKKFLEILEDLFVFRNQEVKLAVQSRILKKRPIVKFLRPMELSTALILKYYLQQMRVRKTISVENNAIQSIQRL